jgi:hypothetical protein
VPHTDSHANCDGNTESYPDTNGDGYNHAETESDAGTAPLKGNT